jgi:hypothetical protein
MKTNYIRLTLTIKFVQFFLILTTFLVTGIITANAQVMKITSDGNEDPNSLNTLRKLRSVTYNFKEENKEQPIPEKFLKDGVDIEKMKAEFKSVPKTNQYLLDRNFYGFVAQDVQKIFPELVYADNAGMLSVDYIGIIPNAPNPFSQDTRIGFYIPETANNASLNIYDLQGKELMQVPINQRKESFHMISGHHFSAGMYLYALIVDGAVIDTKRMILTK